MMQLKSKSLWLIAATSLAAGCAKQDYQMTGPGMMGPGRQGTNPKNAPAYLNAEEEKMPKILPDTHYAAGMLFEQQGQVDKAIQQYRKAVALNHNFAAAYNRLGLMLSAVGAHEEAIEALSHATELRPQNPALRNNLGFEYILMQRWDDAEFQLNQAVDLEPTFARAHVNLGLVRARTGRFDEALDSFRQAMAEPDAYYNLGLTQRGQQKYDQAAASFRRVLELNPDFSAARVQLDQLVDKISAISPTPMPVAAEPQVEPSESADTLATAETTPVEVVPCETTPSATEVMQVLAQLMDQPTAVEPTPEPEVRVVPVVEQAAIPAEPTAEPMAAVEIEFSDEEPVEVAPVEFVAEPTAQSDPLDESAPELAMSIDTTQPCDLVVPGDEAIANIEATEEADADEIIVPSRWIPVEPLTQPAAYRESWEMMNELEQKIAALRHDLTEPPTFVLAQTTIADTFEVPATSVDPIFEEVSVEEIVEDEPTVEVVPHAIEAPATDESREDAIPGDQSSEWSQSFGELSMLLAFVIDETNCLNAIETEYAETTEFIEPMPVDVTATEFEGDDEEIRLALPLGDGMTSGSLSGADRQAIP